MSTGSKAPFTERMSDWFDRHPTLFLLIVGSLSMVAIFLMSLLWGGCPQAGYRGNFLKVTPNSFKGVAWKKTPDKVTVWAPTSIANLEFYKLIDQKTAELEACLKGKGLLPLPKIHREWFAVYVPKDWYKSKCTEEQMIPSSIDYRLCEKKKINGIPIKIPEHCRYVVKPTEACPCPCNARAAIQMGPVHVIVTAPNLKLFKAELARVVLWPKYNMPWVKPVSECLR